MGVKARDELIRMLDEPKTSQQDAGTIIMILVVSAVFESLRLNAGKVWE